MTQTHVIILSGIPGSGKTTWIKENFPSATVVSADLFFTNDKGEYNWDSSKIKEAHQKCFNDFKTHISNVSVLVVDNTNTRLWEFEEYVKISKETHSSLTVVRKSISPEIAHFRCIHNVPLETIKRMENRFENFEGEIFV